MTRFPHTMKAALAAALLAAAAASPAQTTTKADWTETMVKSADANADGMVSRQEFQDHMGVMWDQHHAMMMKKDSKMKPGMMERGQFQRFSKSWMKDPGQIGGN